MSRVAVVTGASSGIGAAIACELAGAGASLVVVGRNRARLREVETRVLSAGAERCEAVALDVLEEDSAFEIVRSALRLGDGIDVLVPCAGVFKPEAIYRATLENFDRQMDVNVRAPFALLAAAATHIRRGGAVVLVSSICGSSGFAGAAAYCATKGAIEMLARGLARELGERGVRINAIAPGIIRTPLNEAQLDGDPAYADGLTERTPLGRLGLPTEVAPAVRFLVSDDARFITGATLPIDGGWLAE